MRGPRKRIAKGIYRDSSGFAVVVCAGRRQKERRLPPDTSMRRLRSALEELRAEVRRDRSVAPRGTLRADAERYVRLIQSLASWREARAEVRAWVALYGKRHRSALTAADVRQAMATWRDAGVAPKTINHRVARLARLFRVLDGPGTGTPCEGVEPLAVPRTPPVKISADLIRQVEANLWAQEQRGHLRDQRTRARFVVLASTGKRASEVMRAQPEDVDLEQRVWRVRDGKGGWSAGLYLNDDMLAAWRLFVEAKAWGAFETSAFARTLRTAGWPKGTRPYQLRHSFGLELSERGEDLADIQAMMGHRRIATTRDHYVPVLGSRIQQASEAIDGRFGWGRTKVPKPGVMAPDPGTKD